MRIVCTGTYNAFGHRLTRNQLQTVCRAAGMEMDAVVGWGTEMVYAENPSGNSSKLQDARSHGKQIRSYEQLHADLTERLTMLNGEVTTTPGAALELINMYGSSGWRRGIRASSPPEIVRHRLGITATPVLPARAERDYRHAWAVGDVFTPLNDIQDVTVGSQYIVRGVSGGCVEFVDDAGDDNALRFDQVSLVYTSFSAEARQFKASLKTKEELIQKDKLQRVAQPGQLTIRRNVKL